MKRIMNMVMVLLCVTAIAAQEQGPIDPVTGLPAGPARQRAQVAELKRFNLEFKGGKPQELVQAIEKAAGMPVNVVIPQEHANVPLPPLKLRDVTVEQVFNALSAASEKVVSQITGFYVQAGRSRPQFQSARVSYGFRTAEKPITAKSVWYFYHNTPAEVPGVEEDEDRKGYCRFWQLEPYLDRFTVDDITTAIETGWQMLGLGPHGKKLSFHKETRLLIAVGTPDELRVIDEVLDKLTSGKGTARVKEPAAKPESSGKGLPERR